MHLDAGFGWASPEGYRRAFMRDLTPQEMLLRVRPHMLRLKPVAAIQDDIERQVRQWPVGVVGVHVRRTDHSFPTANGRCRTCEVGSDRALLRRLGQLSPATHLFVATDNPDSLHLVQAHCPGRSHFHPKTWGNGWRQTSVPEAVVDLYCLARTSQLIGTFYSSFSEYAALLGNVPAGFVNATKELDE